MMYPARATTRAPYLTLGLLLAGLAWLYAGFMLAGAYVDALWGDPPPLLVLASVAWLAVGVVGVVGLHVYLLLQVWQPGRGWITRRIERRIERGRTTAKAERRRDLQGDGRGDGRGGRHGDPGREARVSG